MLVLVGLLVQAILAFRNARPRYMGWVSMHVRRR
jgi:hypothetical protein